MRWLPVLVVTVATSCGGKSPPADDKPTQTDRAASAEPSRKVGRGLQAPSDPVFGTADVSLGELPAERPPQQLALNNAAQRAAWTTREGAIVIDGTAVAGFDSGRALMFSDNGQYVAFVGNVGGPAAGSPAADAAEDKGEDYVVIGDTRLGPYERIRLLHVGNDGRVQFTAGRVGERGVYTDGEPGPLFERIDHLDLVRADPAGPVVAYRGHGTGQQCAVLGTTAQCYATVGRPVLSPDGRHHAHTATESRDAEFIVLDGTANPATHPQINWRIALSDAGHAAYVVAADDGQARQLSQNGSLGATYDRITHLTPSPDRKTIAYAAKDGDGWRLVVNDTALPPSDEEIRKIVLSKDGTGWATERQAAKGGRRVVTPQGAGPLYEAVDWIAMNLDGSAVNYVAKTEAGTFAVIEGAPGEAYDQVGDLRPLADGSVVGVARRGEQWFVTRTGGPKGSSVLGPYDDVGMPRAVAGIPEHNYITSPDGKHVAFCARMDTTWHVVVDGVLGSAHDEVWASDLSFSPDGTRVGYFARSGQTLWWRTAPVPKAAAAGPAAPTKAP